jgi:shikimate dehydrogenase
MKKYLVIGNPIEHSFSPKIHNYWFNKNNIKAVYNKRQIYESDIKEIISTVRNGKINGINVTVPFKQLVIPFIDELSLEAKKTNSVNTIYKKKNKVVGHNTDIIGFELAIKRIGYNIKNKKVFILGAGGVVPSIIVALRNIGVAKIILANRTKKKAEEIKKGFPNIEVLNWGSVPDFNMIINATSVGLKKNDEIKLNLKDRGVNKFFYDVIYNPVETKFLKKAKESGNKVENGKMMFVYQAAAAFKIWHGVEPVINNETLDLLKND